MKKFYKVTLLSTICILFMQTATFAQYSTAKELSWKDQVKSVLPYLGHRNCILITDSAFPMQSNPGVKTIVTNRSIKSVTRKVLRYIKRADHIQPIIYQDAEFAYMKDDMCKRSESLYGYMQRKLERYNPGVLKHDEILEKVEEVAEHYNVVVIKSKGEIPYSSIFIELDCGYWNEGAEELLRESMK